MSETRGDVGLSGLAGGRRVQFRLVGFGAWFRLRGRRGGVGDCGLRLTEFSKASNEEARLKVRHRISSP